jgi:putative ATPase
VAGTGDLFEAGSGQAGVPLAARMRPRDLDEMVGQEHLLGLSAILRKAIEGDSLPSMILYGPAGSGKTTLAAIVIERTASSHERLSAVSAGVADIRRIAQAAQERRKLHSRRTILFIDEIHRLNKTQQDALLPHVEAGTFTLIGATTENPYFSIIRPLLSRCRIFMLHPLEAADLLALMRRALADAERGVAALQPEVSEEALQHIAESAAGDARAALTALEFGLLTTASEADGRRHMGIAEAEAALQRPVLKYDRAGDEHYDTISAFIKSMRGSDPDATIYWLAKMVEAGEDPRFIARRIVIQAAEDVGLADPQALQVAIAAAHAVEYVGMPEAQIPLAMAALYLSTAPKSNSAYKAIAAGCEHVRKEGAARVPGHLAGGVRVEDQRSQYQYPHAHPGGWVEQTYLPPELAGVRFYEPGGNAREQRVAEYLAQLRKRPDRGQQSR